MASILLTALVCHAFPSRAQGAVCDINTRKLGFLPLFSKGVLSPDGRMLAAINADQEYMIMDVETGHVIRRLLSCFLLGPLSPVGTRGVCVNNTTSNASVIDSMSNSQVELQHSENFIQWQWSPNGLMLAARCVNECRVWNASSGQQLATWQCEEAQGLSWSPGPLIAVQGGLFVRFYDPNGTLFSKINMNVSVKLLVWGPNLTLAGFAGSDQIIVFRMDGSTVRTTTGWGYNLAWSPDGSLLGLGGGLHGVELRSGMSLELLFYLEETGPTHSLTGLSSLMLLVTETPEGIFYWNIRFPVRVIPAPQSPDSQALGWVDSDHLSWVNFKGVSGGELNVRTFEWVRYSDIPYPISCTMNDGNIYSISTNGTILVTAHGKRVAHWDGYTSNERIYCSPSSTIATTSGETIYIWDKKGQLLYTTNVGTNINNVALMNETQFGVFSSGQFYLWNFTSSRLESVSSCYYSSSWSPDGEKFVCGMKIFYKNGTQWIRDLNKEASLWSADGSLLLAQSIIDDTWVWICPDFGVELPTEFPIDPFLSDPLLVNPVTLESAKYDLQKIWLSTPVPHKVDIKEASPLQWSVKVTVLGARLLHASTRTMLRWVDSSTLVPQCLFLSGAIVDEYTWVSESIPGLAPAFYTAYFEYPTSTRSPWLGSDKSSFTIECPGGSVPTINITGGFTACACKTHLHAIGTPPAVLGCELCPQHGHCDGSTQVLSDPGYWPLTEDPTHFVPCVYGACPGNNLCAEYYYGPICGLCAAGAGQHGFGRCQKCDKDWTPGLLCLGVVLWFGLCTIQSFFALRSSPKKKNNSSELCLVILSTTQANALLYSVNADLHWFQQALGFAGEAGQSGGGIQTAVFSCFLISAGINPGAVHYIKLTLLLLAPLFAWFAISSFRIGLRWCGATPAVNVFRVPVVVVWLSLQSALITCLFQTLSCTLVDSKYRLSHDHSVPCYDRTYWVMIVLVTIPGLITVILIPLVLFLLLHFRPTEQASGHLKFLIRSYRRDWWFLVKVCRQLLQVGIVTSTRNPFYLGSCMLLACLLHIIIVPSSFYIVHVAETVSLITSAFLFSAVGALNSTTDPWSTYQLGPSVLMMAIVVSYAILLSLLIFDWWKSRDDGYRTKNDEGLMDPDADYRMRHYGAL